MRLSSYVRGCLVQFRVNLVRTLLTLLGIVFGVASVIAMITIGEGAQQQILENIEAMGATLVHVVPGDTTDALVSEIVNDSQGLTLRDVSAIRATLPAGGRAVGFLARVRLNVTSLPVQTSSLNVFAASPDLTSMLKLTPIAGRALAVSDDRTGAPVAVVSAACARRLFGGVRSAVGRRFRLDYRWFEVVGVVGSGAREDRRGSDLKLPVKMQEYRDAVFIPFDAYRMRLRSLPVYGPLDRILVGCRDLGETSRVKSVLERILESTHRRIRDYRIVAPQELLDQQRATQRIFNVVLFSIAAISLLVGGIGIMNIMLANVLERRSEIGIRRALGAKRRHIVIQFLLESTLICMIGGVMGIALGVATSLGIMRLTSIPIALTPMPILLSFGISVAVGLTFGIVPARRAAGTNPVEALHSE